VLDPQGAVISGARVTVRNLETNVAQTAVTDVKGIYSFRELPVGRYDLEVEAVGFKPHRRTSIAIEANSALLIDVAMVLGERTDTVTVKQSEVSVDTQNTQLGEVISGQNIAAVPLNGRSFTDLLALQPGVAPTTTITGQSIQAAGASSFSAAGYLDPGTISINGQREYANGFTVNDADVVERFTMGAAVIPNLDSIDEFRILTGNFDAEYGNYSGGRINVVTKSGSNHFHGSAFNFLRNTVLDARDFFSPARGVFQQNQFGGTVGGPVVRNHAFFFADYQGTRLKQGVATPLIQVPSLQDRTGNLSDLAGRLNGSVNGQNWANILSQRLGYQVNPGEPYYVPGCTSSAQCVLPNATIPQSAWSAPAQFLVSYIPQPNLSGNQFGTSAQNLTLRDDKTSLRLDGNTSWGLLSAYYFLDDYALSNPYPTQQGGANVPGFAASNVGRSISSVSCGCIVIRLTPNGFLVSAAVAAISPASKSGDIAPEAITPKPPAFEIAATRLRSDTQVIAPPMMARSVPRKARPRAHSRSSSPRHRLVSPFGMPSRGAASARSTAASPALIRARRAPRPGGGRAGRRARSDP